MKFVCVECGASPEAGVWGRLNLPFYYLKSLNVVLKLAIWNTVSRGTLNPCWEKQMKWHIWELHLEFSSHYSYWSFIPLLIIILTLLPDKTIVPKHKTVSNPRIVVHRVWECWDVTLDTNTWTLLSFTCISYIWECFTLKEWGSRLSIFGALLLNLSGFRALTGT